ncbi:MAG: DUF3606 domain-containing protein [Pseudomonadota bacterium]
MPTPIDAAADPASQATVEVNDSPSLQHWAEVLGLTPDVLQSAVDAVGPQGDDIKDHLNGGGASGQEDA